MRVYLVLLICYVVSGCTVSGHNKFYKPNDSVKNIPNLIFLEKGRKPEVYFTDNLSRDTYILRSRLYVPIGYSSFNGAYEDENKIKKQATRIGAILALASFAHTNTEKNEGALLLPDSSTTYYSGSIYGGSYSGTSTTFGTTVVPITTTSRRYDQAAIYFVASSKKPRFGILIKDLSTEQRRLLGTNTGAIIDVVVEKSNAFYSNVMPGDILLKIDGVNVMDASHAKKMIKNVKYSNFGVSFTLAREGKTLNIKVSGLEND